MLSFLTSYTLKILYCLLLSLFTYVKFFNIISNIIALFLSTSPIISQFLSLLLSPTHVTFHRISKSETTSCFPPARHPHFFKPLHSFGLAFHYFLLLHSLFLPISFSAYKCKLAWFTHDGSFIHFKTCPFFFTFYISQM